MCGWPVLPLLCLLTGTTQSTGAGCSFHLRLSRGVWARSHRPLHFSSFLLLDCRMGCWILRTSVLSSAQYEDGWHPPQEARVDSARLKASAKCLANWSRCTAPCFFQLPRLLFTRCLAIVSPHLPLLPVSLLALSLEAQSQNELLFKITHSSRF